MAFIRSYDEGDYNITQYSGGGTIRNRLTDEIVCDYTNYWVSGEGNIHHITKKEIEHIEKSLNIKILPNKLWKKKKSAVKMQ